MLLLYQYNENNGNRNAGIPSRRSFTSFDAVTASVRNRLSISRERSVATLSSLLDRQPMLMHWTDRKQVSLAMYHQRWNNFERHIIHTTDVNLVDETQKTRSTKQQA